MVKKYNDDDPIKDLGDFTGGWTYDYDLGDDEGKMNFVNASQVVKYVMDNIHKTGVYQFSLNGKTYQLTIQALLKELIM